MAALLLKKKYLDETPVFEKMSRDKIDLIVKHVQGSMAPNRPMMFMKRCCDILVKVYVKIQQNRQLMKLVESLSQNNGQTIKITLMYLIEIICEYAFDDSMLMDYSGAMEKIFQAGMEDQSNEVRVASFKTLTIFLSSINDEKLVKKFENVLQLLLKKAIELIKYDQETGVTAIESINELSESHPKFIKPIFNDMLMIYTEIMAAPALLTNLRSSSMYGVLLLAMNHAALMRKSDYFKSNMVPTYMKMLSENESISEEEWAK